MLINPSWIGGVNGSSLSSLFQCSSVIIVTQSCRCQSGGQTRLLLLHYLTKNKPGVANLPTEIFGNISHLSAVWFRNKYDHINTEYNLASYVMLSPHQSVWYTVNCVSLPDWVPRHTITSPQLGPMEFQWQVAAPDRLSLAVIINHPKYLHTVNSGYFLSLSRWLKVRSSYHSQTWSEMLLLWLGWASPGKPCETWSDHG